MSNNWIILGVHHSGTTIMQKTLITQPGMSGDVDDQCINKYRESLPNLDNLENISNRVWKHPWTGQWAENTVRFLLRLLKDCDEDIQSEQNVIFMNRPAIEIICSFLLRTNKQGQMLKPFADDKKQTINMIQKQIVYIDWYHSTKKWFEMKFPGNTYYVDLLQFASNPNDVMRILGFHDSKIVGERLGGKERPTDHEHLRAWQSELKPNPRAIQQDFTQHIHSSWLDYISTQIAEVYNS